MTVNLSPLFAIARLGRSNFSGTARQVTDKARFETREEAQAALDLRTAKSPYWKRVGFVTEVERKLDLSDVYATPIGIALNGLRAASLAEAARRAQEDATDTREEWEASFRDLDTLAPLPPRFDAKGGYLNEKAYAAACAKRGWYLTFLVPTWGKEFDYTTHSYLLLACEWSEAKVDTYVAEETEKAAFLFDAFVTKMVRKVGAHLSAVLTTHADSGSSLWNYSEVRVITTDGTYQTEQVWRTKQIWNRSKFGTWFVQFPSRVVK